MGAGVGKAAALGSLTLCVEGHYGGREGDGAPFIWELASPSLPPFLAAPEPSFWLTAMKSACQGRWRRKKITGHQKKKKNLKSKQNKSLPQETEEQIALLDQGQDRLGRHPGPHPRERKFCSMSCCFAQGGNTTHLRLQLTGL